MLIKPASGSCNLRCRYCFYTDEAANCAVPCYGRMSDETLQAAVRLALENAAGSCNITFQGGRAHSGGLDFYRRLMEHLKTLNTRRVPVLYQNNVDPVTISRRLVHSRVSTTQDIYCHLLEQADDTARDTIGSVLFGEKKKQPPRLGKQNTR